MRKMAGQALKLLLLAISIGYLCLGPLTTLQAQDQKPSDITYGDPEETDFC
ncbi:MAG: hypothetical protein HY466_07465 [Deltaproteobacteria bacterium]|nr:hypothetical protein [Deltaproteobacteria bacterium]